MAVAIGEAEYPRLESIKESIEKLSQKAWYIDASRIALDLGTVVLTNIIMAGALVGTGLLPLARNRFENQLRMNFKRRQLALNMKAFQMGIDEVTSSTI